MSVDQEELNTRASVEFAEASVLDTIVPSTPDLDIEDAFQDWDGDNSDQSSSLLRFIDQRQFLLFDEHVPLYLVLRSPFTSKDALKSNLSRLAINLQAHAVDIAPQPPAKDPNTNSNTHNTRPPPQPKDLLHSEDITQDQEPFIAVGKVAGGEDSNENGRPPIYVVWRTTVYLGRPKIRMQKPAIYFAATASLRHFEQKIQIDREDDYLESNAPSPMNLLEPFNHDPAFAGKNLYLSASRVTKVAPATSVANDFSRPLRTSNRKMFQAAPPVILRVHYTRMPPGSRFPVLASLNLEITAFASSKVKVVEIETRLSSGVCETFGESDLQTPAILSPGDETTWIRQLASPNATGNQRDGANIHLFEIRILGEVLLSNACHAKIEVVWKSNVDLGPLPPTPGTRNSQSLSHGRGASISSAISVPAAHRLSSADVGDEQRSPSMDDFGITVTFSSPSQIRVGEILRWDIMLLNRSPHRRTLAIIAIPKRKRAEGKQHNGQGREDPVAHAVLDEHFLFSSHLRAANGPAELVSLNPDLRVG
ncbi:MAG: hypothetical protein M1822_004074 [Bathelium mastoideum]|nr:MAG: hypothetical protein M1822_004074 [Bathelium mastoideum]